MKPRGAIASIAAVRSITVHVPLGFAKRGGRKRVITPDGKPTASAPTSNATLPDSAIVRALAKAFWWRKLLESGVHATIEEMAAAEEVNSSYASRVLRLTMLAPEIIQDILGGRQAEGELGAFVRPFSIAWGRQLASVR